MGGQNLRKASFPGIWRCVRWPLVVTLAIAVVAMALISVKATALRTGDRARPGFVSREGAHFVLDGKPFFVAGVNNHYLTFGSPAEIRRVLDDAVAMGATVVRTFIQPVIGSPDGVIQPTIWDWRKRAASSDLGVHGNYLIYWDPVQNRMALHEGVEGMQRLDYLLDEARLRNVKLIVAFLDFWDYTGGAQQIRAWYGSKDKNTFFFQDDRTKADFKALVRSILMRKNSFNGIIYRDDPTIFAWELMNEPNIEPKELVFSWLTEMSSYVKSLDADHLVSSGGANVPGFISDIDIPTIDFATWHGYPLYYNETVEEMDNQILKYCSVAGKVGKPVLLEEFGYARSNPDHLLAYRRWLDTINRHPDCAGWIVWRLVSLQDDHKYPVDEHDQFDVHNDGGPLWDVLKEGAQQMLKKGYSWKGPNRG